MGAPDSRRRPRFMAAAGLFLLLVGAAPVVAQRPDRAEDRADRARLEERIRARIGEIMRERLELDSAEEATLSSTVREFESRRRALSASEREARRRIDALLEGDVQQTEAEALLRQIVEVRIAEADLFREEQERLLQVLDPARVLEFYELRRQIGQRIRAIRERRRDGDGRGRRGPGGGEEGAVLDGGRARERPGAVTEALTRPGGMPLMGSGHAGMARGARVALGPHAPRGNRRAAGTLTGRRGSFTVTDPPRS